MNCGICFVVCWPICPRVLCCCLCCRLSSLLLCCCALLEHSGCCPRLLPGICAGRLVAHSRRARQCQQLRPGRPWLLPLLLPLPLLQLQLQLQLLLHCRLQARHWRVERIVQAGRLAPDGRQHSRGAQRLKVCPCSVEAAPASHHSLGASCQQPRGRPMRQLAVASPWRGAPA
jgi:hypothetical protein